MQLIDYPGAVCINWLVLAVWLHWVGLQMHPRKFKSHVSLKIAGYPYMWLNLNRLTLKYKTNNAEQQGGTRSRKNREKGVYFRNSFYTFFKLHCNFRYIHTSMCAYVCIYSFKHRDRDYFSFFCFFCMYRAGGSWRMDVFSTSKGR